MAGAKGRSGGARPNSGGSRAGAGRPRKPPLLSDSPTLHTTDPIKFLIAVMSLASLPIGLRIEAARTLLPYFHCRARRP